jgi:membrane protein implicated in regulation of membrane protease activity
MLIGSNLFTSILVPESPRLDPKDLPAAQKIIFGWILSGPAGVAQPDLDEAHVLLCIAKSDTNVLLRKFWEDEEVPQKLPLTKEDEQCEKHFVSTHSCTTESRYMVRLPGRHWRLSADRLICPDEG